MKKAPENIMRCPICKEPMVCDGGIVPWHKEWIKQALGYQIPILCPGIGHAAEKLPAKAK